MAGSIIDSVMSLLGPQVSGTLASQMGESSDTVKRGLEGGAAAMLAGLASKAGDQGFLSQIFGMVTNPTTMSSLSGLISNPASITSAAATGSPLGDLGGKFLSMVFGGRQSAVADAVGQSSGIGASKASSLLAMAAPMSRPPSRPPTIAAPSLAAAGFGVKAKTVAVARVRAMILVFMG